MDQRYRCEVEVVECHALLRRYIDQCPVEHAELMSTMECTKCEH